MPTNNAQDPLRTPPKKPKSSFINDTNTRTTPRPAHTRNATSNPNITTPTSSTATRHRQQPAHSRSYSTAYQPTTPLPLTFPLTTNTDTDTDTIPHPEIDSPLHFSPSKARAAAHQSQQLAILKRWLSSLLVSSQFQSSAHPLIAKWEAEHRALSVSDPELASLQVRWLQETMLANRAADEKRRLVFEAKEAELRRLEGGIADGRRSVGDDLLRDVDDALTDRSRDALDSLAETSVLLGRIPEVNGSSSLVRDLGGAGVDFTLRVQDLQSHIETLESLQRVLEKRLEQAQAQLTAFNEDKSLADKASEVMHPQTAQWNREAKQIGIKINEYKDRLTALERSRPGYDNGRHSQPALVKIEDVVERQDRVSKKKAAVKKLEQSLKSLNGLPPDLEASRNEVKRAKVELERLQAQREELFGILAERRQQ